MTLKLIKLKVTNILLKLHPLSWIMWGWKNRYKLSEKELCDSYDKCGRWKRMQIAYNMALRLYEHNNRGLFE